MFPPCLMFTPGEYTGVYTPGENSAPPHNAQDRFISPCTPQGSTLTRTPLGSTKAPYNSIRGAAQGSTLLFPMFNVHPRGEHFYTGQGPGVYAHSSSPYTPREYTNAYTLGEYVAPGEYSRGSTSPPGECNRGLLRGDDDFFSYFQGLCSPVGERVSLFIGYFSPSKSRT